VAATRRPRLTDQRLSLRDDGFVSGRTTDRRRRLRLAASEAPSDGGDTDQRHEREHE
jgi:hypothetical protein